MKRITQFCNFREEDPNIIKWKLGVNPIILFTEYFERMEDQDLQHNAASIYTCCIVLQILILHSLL